MDPWEGSYAYVGSKLKEKVRSENACLQSLDLFYLQPDFLGWRVCLFLQAVGAAVAVVG